MDIYDETNLPLWSDNPATVDLLGFEDIASPIADAIRRERLNPIAVGIYGPWGSGKTTVLNLLAASLGQTAPGEDVAGGRPRIVLVVRTSPWAYDPNLDVKVTLIGEVLDEIADYALDAKVLPEVQNAIKGLLKKVRWGKAVALAAKTAITVQMPSWDAVEGVFDLDGDDADTPKVDPTMTTFQEDFRKALADLPEVERVVVLVDDLDRCLPDSVIATLEAIKLFLAVEKMAFVIAFDEVPVVEALKTRYDKAAQPKELARQYVEKIIQIPVPIPRLGRDDVATYLAVTMLDGLIDDGDLTAVVKHAAERRSRGERPLLDGHDVNLRGNALDRVKLAERLAPLLTQRLAGNPRRLKRFINDLWMRSAIAQGRGAGLDLDPLAKLMVLEHVYPDRFGDLVAWAAEGTAADRLARIEEGDTKEHVAWSTTGLQEWASLSPKLAAENLKAYLELAASLRAIDFIPPRLTPDLEKVLAELRDREPSIRKAGHESATALAADSRVRLVEALISSFTLFGERQGDLAEAIPFLVRGDDGVGAAVVTEIGKLPAESIEPPTFLRMQQAGVASINDFLNSARGIPAYEQAVSGLGKK